MTKCWHNLVVVAIIIVLTNIYPIVAQEDRMQSGLGVSDMNIVGFVSQMETKRFEVGRVYNTGDFNMTIMSSWVPEGDSKGIQVTVVPQQMFLKPLVAEAVYVEVLGLTVGNYSGKVAFSCDVHLPPTYVGNPSVPSGQANAKFVVQLEETAEPKETPKPEETVTQTSQVNLSGPVVVAVIVSIAIVTLLAVWKHEKRRERMLQL